MQSIIHHPHKNYLNQASRKVRHKPHNTSFIGSQNSTILACFSGGGRGAQGSGLAPKFSNENIESTEW